VDDAGPWYYCVKHATVEQAAGCRSADRLGPYATRAEAEDALTRVAQRNETWDAQDDDDDRS